MAGTFQSGDCLKTVSVPFEQVKAGDVIVFGEKGREDEIVHRAIAWRDGSRPPGSRFVPGMWLFSAAAPPEKEKMKSSTGCCLCGPAGC